MKTSKILKALTLVGFVVLLTSFIVFKTGSFDKYLNSGNEQLNNLQSMPLDTPSAKKTDTTRLNPAMMSTSKSGIILDQKIKFPVKDTLKKKLAKQTPEK